MPPQFAPKEPVELDPPKHDLITIQQLAEANGADDKPCWVAIKGKVYDVKRKDAYCPGGTYHILAGKDASRALAKSSLKEADAVAEWEDLPDENKTTLDGWVKYFTNRYNQVGVLEGSSALGGGEHGSEEK